MRLCKRDEEWMKQKGFRSILFDGSENITGPFDIIIYSSGLVWSYFVSPKNKDLYPQLESYIVIRKSYDKLELEVFTHTFLIDIKREYKFLPHIFRPFPDFLSYIEHGICLQYIDRYAMTEVFDTYCRSDIYEVNCSFKEPDKLLSSAKWTGSEFYPFNFHICSSRFFESMPQIILTENK